jgi:hypothetical protein
MPHIFSLSNRLLLWMTVRIQVLGHLWVLDPMGAGSDSFLRQWVELAPDPHRTGFGCRFHFSPTGALETPKNEMNLKKT